MKRVLTTALFLVFLVVGIAIAHAPIDYTLTCDDEVIGVASSVDGELRFTLLEGVTCGEATLSSAGAEPLVVTLDWDDDGAPIVTIGDESFPAEAVPLQALAGMVTAQENRAEAFANRTRGEEKAAAARERRPEMPDAAESKPDLPDAAESKPDLPDAAESKPDLPDAGGNRR